MFPKVYFAIATCVIAVCPAWADSGGDLAALSERLGIDLAKARDGWRLLRQSHERLQGEVDFSVHSTKQQVTSKTVLSFAVDGPMGTLIERKAKPGPENATGIICTGKKSYILRQDNGRWTLLFANDSPKHAADAIRIRLSFLRLVSEVLSEPAEEFLLRDGFSMLEARHDTFEEHRSIRIDFKWKGPHPLGNSPCTVTGFLIMVPEWNWMIVRAQKTIELEGRKPVCVEYTVKCDPKETSGSLQMVREIHARWIWGEDAKSRMDQRSTPDARQVFTFKKLAPVEPGEVDTSLRRFGISDPNYGKSRGESERDNMR